MTNLATKPSRYCIPALNPGFRMQWEPAQGCHVLLFPEGMVKLNPSAAEILMMCDGKRDIETIIAALADRFPGVDTLSADLMDFVEVANERRWLSFH